MEASEGFSLMLFYSIFYCPIIILFYFYFSVLIIFGNADIQIYYG